MEALVFEKLGDWNVVGGLELSLLVELVGKQRAPVHELFGRQEGVPDIAGMEQVLHKHYFSLFVLEVEFALFPRFFEVLYLRKVLAHISS